MTPMIDIVFLLIIFFMTVSQITRIRDLPVELPTVHGGTSKNKITNVTVNVTQDGDIHVSGKERTVNQVVTMLAELLPQYDNNPMRIKIEIRYDRRGKSKTMNRLVKRLAELGFTQIMPVVSSGQQ